MFHGQSPELARVVADARRRARHGGFPRVGGEHLFLAMCAGGGRLSEVLGTGGASEQALRDAIEAAGPRGAGAASDRVLLGALGVDLDVAVADGLALNRPARPEPLFPLGAQRARRRSARSTPPLGLDARCAWEASLRLALARAEREQRPEHLAMVLVALDPGVAWVLSHAQIDHRALEENLAGAYPSPERGVLGGIQRRLVGHRLHNLVCRYERTTGRATTSPQALVRLATRVV